ncbi:MAG: lipase family protein [Candidatus Thiodiazotropha sp.]
MIKIKAEKYRVTISRNNHSTISTTTVQWQEEIIVKGKDIAIPEGGNWTVFIFFMNDITNAPSNLKSNSLNRLFIFFPAGQYEKILDLLRNEKPVYILYNENHPNSSGIVTDDEPVGEGEVICCGIVDNDNQAGQDDDRPQSMLDYVYDNLQLGVSAHSWQNSYLLAIASLYVYGDWMLENNAGNEFEDDLKERFEPLVRPPMNLKLISDDGIIKYNTGLQAMVLSNDDFILLAFRGTQLNAHDWTLNFTKLAAPTPIIWAPIGAMTHPGFLGSINANYEAIIDAIRDQRSSSSQPLFITGHSLGGALAIIMALRLKLMNDHDVHNVYTYGCPPVSWGTFINVYDEVDLGSLTQRWVNHRDWAPGLPLPGYGHVGIPNYIGADGIATPGMPPTPFLIPELGDHDMKVYANLIRSNMPENLQNDIPSLVF